MSSTKIINVLKDDSFSEILDIFKATPAEEVIFVLPKSAKAFKKEEHFADLRTEAKSLGKAVSFLSSSPELNDMAKKHKFDVLLARSPVPPKVSKPGKINSIDVVNEIEDFYSEPADASESISIKPVKHAEEDDLDLDTPTEEYVPVAAVASRRLDDVFVPEKDNQHDVKVSGKAEKAQPVAVRQDDFADESEDSTNDREIKSMWAAQAAPEIRTAASQRSWSKWFRKSSSTQTVSVKPRRSGPPAHRTGLIALACVAIVVLGTVIFVTTGKAQITIQPASNPLDVKLTVFTSDNIPAVDPVGLSLPGQVFNIQKSISQDFPATGHVDVAQKARGSLTVYNELSTTQQLVATTRFQSADGHIFHTMTSITVPAAKTTNGKLIPGSIPVQIIADKAGSDYNVPVGLFTIPAFKEKGDTEKFSKVYGQADAPIHSGTSGQSTVVTDADLASGKQALSAQLATNIQNELKAQIAGLTVIDNGQVTFAQPSSTNPTASTFNMNLSGTLKTVGFKQTDLDALIAQYVDTHSNESVVASKLTLTYDDIHWDDARNGLVFTVHVTGPGYSKIDQNKIVTDLMGLNDAQIKAYLGGISAISSAHVSLSPFWVRSVPKSQDKIKVDLSY